MANLPISFITTVGHLATGYAALHLTPRSHSNLRIGAIFCSALAGLFLANRWPRSSTLLINAVILTGAWILTGGGRPPSPGPRGTPGGVLSPPESLPPQTGYPPALFGGSAAGFPEAPPPSGGFGGTYPPYPGVRPHRSPSPSSLPPAPVGTGAYTRPVTAGRAAVVHRPVGFTGGQAAGGPWPFSRDPSPSALPPGHVPVGDGAVRPLATAAAPQPASRGERPVLPQAPQPPLPPLGAVIPGSGGVFHPAGSASAEGVDPQAPHRRRDGFRASATIPPSSDPAPRRAPTPPPHLSAGREPSPPPPAGVTRDGRAPSPPPGQGDTRSS